MRSIFNQIIGTCALLAGIAAAQSQQLIIASETAEWRAWVGQQRAIYVGDVWEPMETKANISVADWSTSQPNIFVEPDLGSTKQEIPDGTYLFIYTGTPEGGSSIYIGHQDFPPYSSYSINDEWETVDGHLLPKGETESNWYMTEMWYPGTLGIVWWTVTPDDPKWLPVKLSLSS
ncbi:unnamed protein product [Clonostachys byssicola]|uniref:Glycoside hydrolase family 43 protein n=1 Tax=Clonostachys byssicola TaxID=160290 RepID=A0A9N9UG18_9HYPO|nr:unnamed protein product [Clonostachys byssicola]